MEKDSILNSKRFGNVKGYSGLGSRAATVQSPVAFIRWKLQGVVRYSAGRYGGNSERFLNLEMVGSGVWRA